MTTRTEEMATGSYRAEWRPDSQRVHLTAEGMTPRAGYRVWLERSPLSVFPPEYVLRQSPPDGFAADMMTPFRVEASFPAEVPVDEVIVHDAAGRRPVPVTRC